MISDATSRDEFACVPPSRHPSSMDELDDDARNALQGRRAIGIDPNMEDLLFCVAEDGITHYRYTKSQRRQESKAKKYRDLVLRLQREAVIEGRTVEYVAQPTAP